MQRLPYTGGSPPKGESYVQDCQMAAHNLSTGVSTTPLLWDPRHKPPGIHVRPIILADGI
jgi:hypothetical protein